MTVKYAAFDYDPYGTEPFDTKEALLEAYGWKLRDGLWWRSDDTEGSTFEEALVHEDVHEVRPFKVGASGVVRVSCEAEVYAFDEAAALEAAKELPDLVVIGDMELDAPDSHDFDHWAKEIKQ